MQDMLLQFAQAFVDCYRSDVFSTFGIRMNLPNICSSHSRVSGSRNGVSHLTPWHMEGREFVCTFYVGDRYFGMWPSFVGHRLL